MKIALVFLIVVLAIAMETSSTGVCVLRMVDGKMQKYGDCDEKKQSQVLKDLDDKLEKYKRNHESCRDMTKSTAKVKNTTGGVFDIYPESMGSKVEVYCNLVTDGGGWTVFQRRMDGSENFYRGWDDYVNGFGRKDKEFWLGLENIYQMTKNGNYELRVDLEDFYGNHAFAKYGSFRIDSSAQNYRLHVSSYFGNAGDSLASHNWMEFSTHDADHDIDPNNCAKSYSGAWWYHTCYHSALNSLYHDLVGTGSDGVIWLRWKNRWEYLKFTEMKFRRK